MRFSHTLFITFSFAITGLLAATSSLTAEATDARSLELFEKHIRPTLVDQCIRCHGPKKQQGGLRLDSRDGLMKGGDSGEVVTLGDPDNSILIEAIRYKDPALEMPPKGRLPETTIKAFEEWVASGAVDPRVSRNDDDDSHNGPPSVEEGRKFWSFQPVREPTPPPTALTDWPITNIDKFILAKLESAGIQPNEPADRRTLIRRVYYDLIGLPPTPEQISEFVNDSSLNAYEKLVDQLLESHHFGERWGRHWLDVVRFAESSGGGRTLLFPNAWRYRDYVIDAFNSDMPYNQFITEQIAGDLIEHGDWQDKRRKLTATAYLLLGPTNYELQDKDVLEMDVVDEQLDTIGKSFLGMTIGCARCHDHKFDPIPTKDYYALAGILKSTKAMIHSNVSTWNKVALPVPPDEESCYQKHEASVAALKEQIDTANEELKQLGGKPSRPNAKRARGTPIVPSETIEGIVVDDEEAELVGSWTPSTSVARYVDGKYIHDGTAEKGKKSATFRPKLPKLNTYEVRIAYSRSSNRSSRVPIHVHHADGETVIPINQKERPEIDDVLTSVGVFRFDPGMDPRVVISNEGTEDGVVIADAVVFVPTERAPLPSPSQVDIPENIAYIVRDPSSLEGVVLDDTDAVLVGEWKHSVHTPPFVGASYIHDLKDGKGKKSATFTPDLPAKGLYEVRISHNTNIRRATNVPITIKHSDGETTILINEGEEAPINKLFRSLGEFPFKKGKHGSVTFSTQGTDGKNVIVDAVQFIPLGEEATTSVRRKEELTAKVKQLQSDLSKLEKEGPKRPIAMVTGDDEDAGDIHLAIRGVVHNKGPMVPRGVLQVAASAAELEIPKGESGRRELAAWIASPDHPLTARVMVNRVWYWLMNRGIVSSVDNFGSMGQRPTHPELLDYLATSFVQQDWSVKQLIREIMLSRVYQLDTQDIATKKAIDPDNQLFWRMNRKRLRAEDIRDTLLFVGGTLNQDFGGSNFSPGTKSEYGYKFKSTRRSVYVPVFRNVLPEIFEVFDFSDPNIQRGSRTSSTIASQALLLMNHPFVIEQSTAAATRLSRSDLVSTSEKIENAYLQVIGRPPTGKELEIAAEFIESGKGGVESWSQLFQTLFSCVDFRYLN